MPNFSNSFNPLGLVDDDEVHGVLPSPLRRDTLLELSLSDKIKLIATNSILYYAMSCAVIWLLVWNGSLEPAAMWSVSIIACVALFTCADSGCAWLRAWDSRWRCVLVERRGNISIVVALDRISRKRVFQRDAFWTEVGNDAPSDGRLKLWLGEAVAGAPNA